MYQRLENQIKRLDPVSKQTLLRVLGDCRRGQIACPLGAITVAISQAHTGVVIDPPGFANLVRGTNRQLA